MSVRPSSLLGCVGAITRGRIRDVKDPGECVEFVLGGCYLASANVNDMLLALTNLTGDLGVAQTFLLLGISKSDTLGVGSNMSLTFALAR